jgi:hypothetical protein
MHDIKTMHMYVKDRATLCLDKENFSTAFSSQQFKHCMSCGLSRNKRGKGKALESKTKRAFVAISILLPLAVFPPW